MSTPFLKKFLEFFKLLKLCENSMFFDPETASVSNCGLRKIFLRITIPTDISVNSVPLLFHQSP